MKKLFLLATAAFLPVLVFSQFSFKGKVLDKESRESLPGAHIQLLGTYYHDVSGPGGEFTIQGIKKGDYTLIVSFMGYKKLQKKVNIKGDMEMSVELIADPILQDEVIIRSTRASLKSPLSFSNISKKEIEEVNMGQDLPYIISSSPSVTTTSDAGAGIGYTSIRVRGTDMRRINVTVNGIPLNDPESHNVFWVDLPDIAASVDNIQIQRGVGTSTNGAAAFGASINLQTTSRNEEAYALIDNAYGSFNTIRNAVSVGSGLIAEHFIFDARVSRVKSDGYIDRSGSELKSFFVSAAWYSKNSLLKANIFSGKERTMQAWEGIPSEVLDTNRTYNPAGMYVDNEGKIRYYGDQSDNYVQDHYQLLASHKFSSALYLNAALHLTYGKGYYESYKTDEDIIDYGPGIFFENENISSTDLIRQKWLDNVFYGATYSLNYNPDKRLNISLGGAWNKYDGDHYGKVIWGRSALVLDKDKDWYFNNGMKTDFNVYAKLNYSIIEKLQIMLDLQYRKIHYEVEGIRDDLAALGLKENFGFFNPKLGLAYQISETQDVYFSYAIANREPSRDNYVDADAGMLPTSERLSDYELGYKYRSSGLFAGINFYYMDYKDQLVLTGEINNVGDPIMVNVDKSYRAGLEISSGIKIFKSLSWEANLTLSKNKIKDFVTYVDNWNTWSQEKEELGTSDLSFSPEIIGNSHFIFKPLKNLKIGFHSNYVGRQYIDNTSSKNRSLDPYFINNLSIYYNIHTASVKNIGLSLQVNNIFNEEYESKAWVYRYYYNGEEGIMDGYFPQAGINIMAGLKLGF